MKEHQNRRRQTKEDLPNKWNAKQIRQWFTDKKAPYMDTSINLEKVCGVDISSETIDLLK